MYIYTVNKYPGAKKSPISNKNRYCQKGKSSLLKIFFAAVQNYQNQSHKICSTNNEFLQVAGSYENCLIQFFFLLNMYFTTHNFPNLLNSDHYHPMTSCWESYPDCTREENHQGLSSLSGRKPTHRCHCSQLINPNPWYNRGQKVMQGLHTWHIYVLIMHKHW